MQNELEKHIINNNKYEEVPRKYSPKKKLVNLSMTTMSKYIPKPLFSPKLEVLAKPKYSISPPPESKLDQINKFCKKLEILDEHKRNQVKLDFASGYFNTEQIFLPKIVPNYDKNYDRVPIIYKEKVVERVK